MPAVKQIFKGKYFNIKTIKRQHKTKYHLIGVFSSNLLVGLISSINTLSKSIGWTKEETNTMIAPIMKTTLNNAIESGVISALSGALERGDIVTVQKHLRILQENKDLLNIYKNLSLAILKNFTKDSKKKKIITLLTK